MTLSSKVDLGVTNVHNLTKSHTASCYTYGDMNYLLHLSSSSEYGQTKSNAYQPTMQSAQVGSKREKMQLDVEMSPPAFSL